MSKEWRLVDNMRACPFCGKAQTSRALWADVGYDWYHGKAIICIYCMRVFTLTVWNWSQEERSAVIDAIREAHKNEIPNMKGEE